MVNSVRGNLYFGSCGTGTPNYNDDDYNNDDGDSNKNKCYSPAHTNAANDTTRDSYTFLPPQEKRGDIARAILYMDLRYDGSEVNTLELIVSDCPDSIPNKAGMGYLSQLLQWHAEDIVDEEEMERNDSVCRDWQGNRNPFVDFPDLVEVYFGKPFDGYYCRNGTAASALESTEDTTASTLESMESTYFPTVQNTPRPMNQPTDTPVKRPTKQPTDTLLNGLLITGVIDGPLTGGLPKAIELYAVSDVDLSLYGVGFANNGKGSPGLEFRFPSGASAAAGSHITISYEESQFTAFFGVSPDYVTGYASINGNDAIELYMNDSVVDVYGDANVDGTGTVWDYMDGWAYRMNGSIASTVFDSEGVC